MSKRKLKPAQIKKLTTIDFDKYAKTLFDEAHKGQAHLDILEGLTKVDPFILNQSSMFWQFTIWAHAQVAMMYATKLFDPTEAAFSVPKFFHMARMRAKMLAPSREAEMLKAIDEGEKRYKKLKPHIIALARRRNRIYAHISEELILGTVYAEKTKVTFDHIRKVLTEATAVLNSLTVVCRSSVTVGYMSSHTSDYEQVISLLNEGLCRKADEQEKEYAQYGGSLKAPRPRNCP
jgi:HEPN superfamily AbiU2-like protein